MEVYEVSPAVNKVANDTPAVLEPYDSSAAPEETPKTKPKRQAEDSRRCRRTQPLPHGV